MRDRAINILFQVGGDIDNYNAQSLNAREIALRLDPARFHCTFFLDRSPDPRLLRPGIRLVKLPPRRKTIRILREMLAGYDMIVYVDFSPSSFTFLHLPRVLRRGTRVVLCTEGSTNQLATLPPISRKYARFAIFHADVRTAISEHIAADLEHFCGHRTNLILPVGVDTKIFIPPPARDHRVPTVLFVGHLIERKGPQFVLAAARQFPQARFRLIGAARDNFWRDSMRDFAAAELTNLTVEDPMHQTRLAEVMGASDILMLPSRMEGVPKVTLEAAATGLPCVIFNDYKTPSVVDGVTGFQVETPEQMMRSIGLLLGDELLRRKMSAAAVEHAKQFDWDRVATHWTETFSLIMEKKPHSHAM